MLQGRPPSSCERRRYLEHPAMDDALALFLVRLGARLSLPLEEGLHRNCSKSSRPLISPSTPDETTIVSSQIALTRHSSFGWQPCSTTASCSLLPSRIHPPPSQKPVPKIYLCSRSTKRCHRV